MLSRRQRTAYGRRTHPVADGVNFIGYTHHASGLGAAARGNYKVLRTLAPCLPFAFPGTDDVIGNPYSVNFHHWHPEDAIVHRLDINPVDVFHGRVNIGFWVLETTGVSECWLRNSERFDEIWTASSFCRAVLENNGVQCPVRVLPHALHATPGMIERERRNCLPGFHFLTLYDSHSRISRKNPLGVIWAFRSSFPRDEPVRLTVKIRNACPGERELLHAAASYDPRVSVVDQEFTGQEMAQLYQDAHAFVSLHRGEGFGLHIAEAMLSGLVVVMSGCGGCLDFARHDRVHWVAVADAPVNDLYFRENGGTWWEPDLGHAASLMRRLWEEYGEATTGDRLRAAQAVRQELAPETICARAKILISPHL
jgi:glycosyltransferase involved in cell wall biosynthesis